jgi:hypothetical protein
MLYSFQLTNLYFGKFRNLKLSLILLLAERKILQKVFLPNEVADCSWIIKTKEIRDKMIQRKNIAKEIKSRKI